MKNMGTTTAGIMVLRLDEDGDDLLLFDPVGVAMALLEEEPCDIDGTASVALRELNCAALVTTEEVMNVVVDIAPPASVTMLSRVTDMVVKEVGAAADVMASVPDQVMDVEMRDGNDGVSDTREVVVRKLCVAREEDMLCFGHSARECTQKTCVTIHGR